jgi:uncharacterized protein with von Willebrand factor type A (vWA) domain
VSGPGPLEAVTGFIAHLRANGFRVGPAETFDALDVIAKVGLDDAARLRLALKTLLTGEREQWNRFDALFEAYWLRRGRVRDLARPRRSPSGGHGRLPAIWQNTTTGGTGEAGSQGDDGREAMNPMAASGREALTRTDLRHLLDPELIGEAERLAERLARAIVHRLSRRRLAARRGASLDIRRMIRRNLARGGEPVERVFRTRPDRPVRLVALVDVSGSMKVYSRFFLLFVRGLMARWLRTDAYLFHTRLARITSAFQDRDRLAAMARLSLVADGFGGGTRIAGALATFNRLHAREAIDRRTVVVIMSDGYDTDEPEALARELGRLKARARRIIWLNPLIGWKDYAPVARGMAAAMPHIDLFAAAHTLDGLAALESELARL